MNKQTNEQARLLHSNTVCLQINCCGFEGTNGNHGNQTSVGLIVKLYLNNYRITGIHE